METGRASKTQGVSTNLGQQNARGLRRAPGENKLVCTNCGRDTFAIRRENGLEVKYRDRWILVLNDTVGTVLFRCRLCKSVSAYHLENAAITGAQTPAQLGDSTSQGE
jgi:hypothetical protein